MGNKKISQCWRQKRLDQNGVGRVCLRQITQSNGTSSVRPMSTLSRVFPYPGAPGAPLRDPATICDPFYQQYNLYTPAMLNELLSEAGSLG